VAPSLDFHYVSVFRCSHASWRKVSNLVNIFNRVNLTQPVSELSSSLFAQSMGQSFSRFAQFGIHFSF
jgi:hypothetical protein